MPHHSRLAAFIIDCKTDDLEAATSFWSEALGLPVANPNAGDEPGMYAELGDTPGDLDIEVQRVEHESRIHLDIESDDIDAEADRLEALAAKRIGFVKRWWVMQAPTGQRFCVIKMHHPERGKPPKSWGASCNPE